MRIPEAVPSGAKGRRNLFARKLAAISVPAVFFLIGAVSPTVGALQIPTNSNDAIQAELLAMNRPGAIVAQAREQVLTILQGENGCSAWYRQADSKSAGVFRSLHYEIREDRPSYVSLHIDTYGREILKHPWGARSGENAGRDSFIELNADGPFFNSTSPMMQMDLTGIIVRPAGYRSLIVGSFRGNTIEARIAILLHELGHVVGRLPEDADAWDGRSQRNTEEVLRHCKRDIRAVSQTIPRDGK